MKRLSTPIGNALLALVLLCSTPTNAELFASGDAYPQCAAARDPGRCAARLKAREICRGQRGAVLRECMSSQRPPLDCSKARYPERCLARQTTDAACRDKSGTDQRKCLRER